MELRPYYDRPTGQIKSYLSLIESKIASNFPHWGRGSQGVWPKGDYGKGILSADQFSILGTFGQWLIPLLEARATLTQLALILSAGLARLLSFKSLEEFFYLIMGIQYPVTPLLITEHQWQISGIETPVLDQQIFRSS